MTLTASADTGWTFDSWSGDVTGSTNPITLTMDANKIVTATFTQNQYSLTTHTVGSGSVGKQPDQATYGYGDVVTLTATSDAGWTFNSWSGDATGSTNPITLTIDANKVVTATFTQNQYSLTTHTVGSGSVSKQPDQATYVYGDVVTLTATSDAGWTFSQWSGDVADSTNPITLTMDANKIVTATFTQDQYNLTVNTVGSGGVSKQPDQATYIYGDVVTLTASANTGWAFASWSGDVTGSTNPITLTIDGNKVVTATFIMQKVATRITLAVFPPNPTAGAPITLTATVTQAQISGAGLAAAGIHACPFTGMVEFTVNGNPLGQATPDGNCQATLTLGEGLPAGSYSFQATYAGDAASSPSTSSVQSVTVSPVETERALYLPLIWASNATPARTLFLPAIGKFDSTPVVTADSRSVP